MNIKYASSDIRRVARSYGFGRSAEFEPVNAGRPLSALQDEAPGTIVAVVREGNRQLNITARMVGRWG